MTTISILDHGAVADGTTLTTAAIQAAIDAAGQTGGVVHVPAGTWRIGTIFLRSHVTLDLAPNAVLLGSDNLEDYAEVRWGHHKDRTPWHLIVADDCDHVTIQGTGVIDGSGPAFWKHPRKHDWAFWVEEHARPSPMVEITNCRDVRVKDVTLRHAAGWTLHLHDCDRSWITGIRIQNTLFGPNTDGIDVTGCHELVISDCIISTGDDAIAFKTTSDSRSCEYCTVTNCVLETNCVAVRVGYESKQDFRHITVSNCVVKNCSRAINLLSTQGCIIEHVVITGLQVVNNSGWPVDRPIEIGLHQVDDACTMCDIHPNAGVPDPTPAIGAIRDILIANCDFLTSGRVMIGASAGGVIENVTLAGIRLRYGLLDDPLPLSDQPMMNGGYFFDLRDLRCARAAIVAENVRNLRISDLDVHWPRYPVSDRWNVLVSDQRHCNPDWYVGHEDAIRTGERRPTFQVFWGKELWGGRIDLTDQRGSEDGVEPCHLIDCQTTVLT